MYVIIEIERERDVIICSVRAALRAAHFRGRPEVRGADVGRRRCAALTDGPTAAHIGTSICASSFALSAPLLRHRRTWPPSQPEKTTSAGGHYGWYQDCTSVIHYT